MQREESVSYFRGLEMLPGKSWQDMAVASVSQWERQPPRECVRTDIKAAGSGLNKAYVNKGGSAETAGFTSVYLKMGAHQGPERRKGGG